MSNMVSQDVKALCVRDRVVTSLGRVLQVSERLRDDRAREHLKHGLARRLRLLHVGIAEIVDVAYPRRREPLSDTEQLNLTLHLNSFYLHIHGCLDNLAWCLAHELKLFGSQNEKEIALKVNLFGKPFLRVLSSAAPDLAACVRRHAEWHRDLKNIRDPVAHRIPIYAVPAMLTSEEAERYRDICNRAEEARIAGNLDRAGQLFNELNGIGDYMPYFAHSPSTTANRRKVYPQVADDLLNVLELVEDVITYLERRPV